MSKDFKLPKIPVKKNEMSKDKLAVEPQHFEGVIEPLTDYRPFYMVVVEHGIHPPQTKHETYQEAFLECLRLSKKENKKAFVLKSLTQVEQVPNVVQFKD